MASATFTLTDTPEVRAELRLLLQRDPKQFSHDGLITVEFQDVLEDQAMHVLSRSVANHGFIVSEPVKPAETPKTQPKSAPSPNPKKDSK